RSERLSEIGLGVEARDDREAVRAADALDALARLHAAGLYRDAFSFDHVDRVAVTIGLKEVRSQHVLKTTGAFPSSNVRTAKRPDAAASGAAQPARAAGQLVTWDHIISPDESEALIGQLAAYPEVKAYKAGRSYRGRDISVLEITNPTTSELVS